MCARRDALVQFVLNQLLQLENSRYSSFFGLAKFLTSVRCVAGNPFLGNLVQIGAATGGPFAF
jgi:hypothetical protein